MPPASARKRSYIEPEILRFPKGTVETFLASEPRLKIYRFYLENIARRAAHTLSDAEEKILAEAGPLSGSPSNIFNILSNADFPYPTITLSDGRTAKVDQAGYNSLRALPNRADRQKAMSAFFQTLGGFSRTFGTTMNGEVEKVRFLLEGPEVSLGAGAGPRRPEYPAVGLHAADRRRQSQPADVPPLPEAAEADDGR